MYVFKSFKYISILPLSRFTMADFIYPIEVWALIASKDL